MSESSTLLTSLQALINRMPFSVQVPMTVHEAHRGFVVVEITPRSNLFNHFGTYQAGVLLTLTEVTGGILCGTFLDLTQNLLITRKTEFSFAENTNMTIRAEAAFDSVRMEAVLAQVTNKRKATISVDVRIKSESGRSIGTGVNEYYLRLGIPRSFAGGKTKNEERKIS